MLTLGARRWSQPHKRAELCYRREKNRVLRRQKATCVYSKEDGPAGKQEQGRFRRKVIYY